MEKILRELTDGAAGAGSAGGVEEVVDVPGSPDAAGSAVVSVGSSPVAGSSVSVGGVGSSARRSAQARWPALGGGRIGVVGRLRVVRQQAAAGEQLVDPLVHRLDPRGDAAGVVSAPSSSSASSRSSSASDRSSSSSDGSSVSDTTIWLAMAVVTHDGQLPLSASAMLIGVTSGLVPTTSTTWNETATVVHAVQLAYACAPLRWSTTRRRER